MSHIQFILKNTILFTLTVFTALGLTYKFGFAPLLRAQTPPLPTSTQISTQTAGPDAAKASGSTVDAKAQNAQNTSFSIDRMVPQKNEDGSFNPNGASLNIKAPPQNIETNIPAQAISRFYKYTKSYVGDTTNPDRDPFRKPIYLLDIEEESSRPLSNQNQSGSRIDERMEAIRRWPVTDYRVIAIIWDVRNPKAMLMDPTNAMHMIKKNNRVGDAEGIVSAIDEGTVTVMQAGTPIVLKLLKKPR